MYVVLYYFWNEFDESMRVNLCGKLTKPWTLEFLEFWKKLGHGPADFDHC